MIRRRLIIGSAILALFCLLLALFSFSQRRTAAPSSFRENVAADVVSSDRSSNNLNSVVGKLPSAPFSANPNVIPASRNRNVEAAMARMNVPINFWGRVVDQENLPLSDVSISVRLRQWLYQNEARTISKRYELSTDAAGAFQIIGAEGDSLELESITKQGYRLSPNAQRGYSYAHSFQSHAEDPVIIRMWKLVPKEPLITHLTLFRFIPDGRAYTLDLLDDKCVQGAHESQGDMTVKVTRPIQAPRPYDWSVDFEVIGAGGLIEAQDEFGYRAPSGGYKNEVSVHYDATNSDWSDSVTKDYYICSRHGNLYGFLHLRIRAQYDGQSAVHFETRLNPNGSRNLQP